MVDQNPLCSCVYMYKRRESDKGLISESVIYFLDFASSFTISQVAREKMAFII